MRRCEICSASAPKGGFHCAGCARAALYPLRLQLAQTLLDSESTARPLTNAVQRSATIHPGKATGAEQLVSVTGDTDSVPLRNKLEYSQTAALLQTARQQVARISHGLHDLEHSVEEYKKTVAAKKAALAARRKNLGATRTSSLGRLQRQLDATQKDVALAVKKYDGLQKNMALGRDYNSRRAAALVGLKRGAAIRSSQLAFDKDGGLAVYTIGFNTIPDLHSLTSSSPEVLTAGLTHIARLLCQVCHYLHIRLPAEVTIPHRDYPLPTILHPTSSYSGAEPQFPALFQGNSPKSSRTELDTKARASGGSRPRPLFLDRPLVNLVKEEPIIYALFVEGLALLAWDITWLCRTQGLAVASSPDQWRQLYDFGGNLWNLLVASPRDTPQMPHLGVHSHGTARNFLRSATVPPVNRDLPAGFVDVSPRGWPFASPTKAMHELRQWLLNEMSGHDWELLDGEDNDEENVEGHAHGTLQDTSGGVSRPKGSGGYLKLKSRNT